VIGDPCTQVLRHEPLEGRPLDLLGTIDRSARPEGSIDAGVEEVELWMGRGLAPRPLREDLDPERKEEILQDLHVPGDGPLLELALPGHVGHVQHGPMRKADDLEETREGSHVAGPSFELDLLLEVEGRVGAERVLGTLGGADEGYQTKSKRLVETKRGKLGGHEGVQGPQDGSPREEVDAAAPQLARARTGEDELRVPPPGQVGVNDAQDLRHALDLVQNDHLPVRGAEDQLIQPFGPGLEVAIQVRLEQIDEESVGNGLTEPCRLARSAGSEQEEALFRQREESILYFHFETQIGNTTSEV
jgi:hypothetical protein